MEGQAEINCGSRSQGTRCLEGRWIREPIPAMHLEGATGLSRCSGGEGSDGSEWKSQRGHWIWIQPVRQGGSVRSLWALFGVARASGTRGWEIGLEASRVRYWGPWVTLDLYFRKGILEAAVEGMSWKLRAAAATQVRWTHQMEVTVTPGIENPEVRKM